MTTKNIIIQFSVLTILLALAPAQLFAKTLPAGFSKDQIWFSKDPFFVGDNITVNTFVYNSTAYRMSGSILLKDGTTTIDKRTFILEGGGSSQTIAFPWVVTPGTHNFVALIEKDEFTQGTSSLASSTITSTETSKVKRFADYDKNANGVGDSTEPPPPVPVKFSKSTTSTSTINISLPADPIADVKQRISDEAPTPVSSVALPVISTIENVRLSQGGKAGKSLDRIESIIAAQSGTTSDAVKLEHGGRSSAGWSMLKDGLSSGQVVRSPLDYIKLLFALVLHFFTNNPYAFYILLLLIIYKLASLVIGLFR